MNRVLTTLAWCYIALCAACEGTEAAPPEGVALDPATVAWFEGLVRSDGLSCCGAGDCKPEHIEVVNGQIYAAQFEGKMSPVDNYKIVRRDTNPLGATVVCRAGEVVYCVVPYSAF